MNNKPGNEARGKMRDDFLIFLLSAFILCIPPCPTESASNFLQFQLIGSILSETNRSKKGRPHATFRLFQMSELQERKST